MVATAGEGFGQLGAEAGHPFERCTSAWKEDALIDRGAGEYHGSRGQIETVEDKPQNQA